MDEHAAAPRDAAAYRTACAEIVLSLLIETKLIVIGIERELNWHRGLQWITSERLRARAIP